MKFILTALFITTLSISYSQIHPAHLYSFKATTSLEYDKEIQIKTPITFTGEILSIINGNYQLVIAKNNQPESNFNLTTENVSDTLLYDLENKKVYVFSEKKGMHFSKPIYSPGADNRYTKEDAEIEFSNKIPADAMPFPIIVRPKKGLKWYKNKNTQFTYVGIKKVKINLEDIIKRYKSFEFDDKFMPNPY